jgi:hypothetical protein
MSIVPAKTAGWQHRIYKDAENFIVMIAGDERLQRLSLQ